MFQTIIVADDLTGANDTGALLAQSGFRVGTILRDDRIDDFSDFDALCISTDSRAMTAENAYEAVYTATKLFPYSDKTLFSKRIDSTLRGNMGAEIDAILDAMDTPHKAVVVAAFPSSGRTCIGDILLVGGTPLQLTEVAHDPINPITTSRVSTLIKQQTKRSVGYIGIDAVNGDLSQLSYAFEACAATNDVIVIDAQTDENIDNIAKVCAKSKHAVVAIDPGTFTNALSRERFSEHKSQDGKTILAVIGSVSELTRKQIAYLTTHDTPALIAVNVEQLFEKDTRDSEVMRVAQEVLVAAKTNALIVVATLLPGQEKQNLDTVAMRLSISKRDVSQIITNALAKICLICTTELKDDLGGLYLSGGDVAAASSAFLNTSGFDVKREVIPLAIYSRMINGVAPDLPIVTKGGLIGQENTLKYCIDYLREVLG